LKHANNDPNLAMSLIAVCGHDDVAQGTYYWLDDSLKAKEEVQFKLKYLNKDIDSVKSQLSGSPSNNPKTKYLMQELTVLADQKAKIQEQNGIKEEMYCPSGDSKTYLPQSLGQGVDIPDELKAKITNLQAPTKGAAYLPAKHYHVYGSAFMACQLIQEGVLPEIATILQKNAARFYRGIRMCKATKDLLTDRNELLGWYDKYIKDFKPVVEKKNTKRGLRTTTSKPYGVESYIFNEALRLAKSGECIPPQPPEETEFIRIKKSNYNSNISTEAYKEHKRKMLLWNKNYRDKCNFLRDFIGVSLADSDLNEEIIRTKTSMSYEKMNAAYLYQKWYIGGGELLDLNLPCTDYRLFGPSSLVKKKRPQRANHTENCISGFSARECQKAKERLATWDVDFEWTINQHEVGAEFAAKMCKKNEKRMTSLEQLACASQNSLNKDKKAKSSNKVR
ncbi:MAG: hypothetical protein KDD58_09100, partial [Bdellovibrionales bacterium]|nr:hypothetical protein [Bdellovibrionales bacterium]